jgi:type VI secretion system secreted protein Hcp
MPAYIKIPGVKGEVNEEEHGNNEWVEVNSVSLPIFRSIQGGAVGVARSNGETTLGDISVYKTWDSSTPGLASAVANGEFKDEVLIHLCSTINKKNVVNLELKLKNVILSSYSFSATGDQSPVPSESLTLNYTAVEWTYKKFNTMGDEDGNFPATYDTEKARN